MQSFLSDRQQYVFFDGMESEVIKSGNSSVCQGSKLSSLLYILYTNEIPLLDKLTNTDIYDRLTDSDSRIDRTNIDQYRIQYVDDSPTMITTNDTNDIKMNVYNFFLILE